MPGGSGLDKKMYLTYLKRHIVARPIDWTEIAMLIDEDDMILGRQALFTGQASGADDYEENVFEALKMIAFRSWDKLLHVARHVDFEGTMERDFPGLWANISGNRVFDPFSVGIIDRMGILQEIRRIKNILPLDPDKAAAEIKQLIERTCRQILIARNVHASGGEPLPTLLGLVEEKMVMDHDKSAFRTRETQIMRMTMSHLGEILMSIGSETAIGVPAVSSGVETLKARFRNARLTVGIGEAMLRFLTEAF